jgi:hypothetical protein
MDLIDKILANLDKTLDELLAFLRTDGEFNNYEFELDKGYRTNNPETPWVFNYNTGKIEPLSQKYNLIGDFSNIKLP